MGVTVGSFSINWEKNRKNREEKGEEQSWFYWSEKLVRGSYNSRIYIPLYNRTNYN